ncbi:MAG: transposase [Myxococcales bacterium]|nr:transposase [Myxococcales bacterium]
MPRQARLVVPGVPHHLYLRGNNRRRLFSSSGDYALFVRCLDHGLKASECVLHQLTLMSNHVHMVAKPPTKVALATLVQRAGQRYAQLRNAARSASGKLFEERFHSKPILDDTYLMTVTIYNDVNAYRAKRIIDPFTHAWSTGPLHAGVKGGRIPPAMWTPSPWYGALGATAEQRARRYRELVAAYLGAPGQAPVDDGVDGMEDYSLRLERPDRSTASEIQPRWGGKAP